MEVSREERVVRGERRGPWWGIQLCLLGNIAALSSVPGEASLQCCPGRGAGASGSLTSCSRSATLLQLKHPGKPALREENHPAISAGASCPQHGEIAAVCCLPDVSGLRATQRLLLHPPVSLSLRMSPACPLGGQGEAVSLCSLPAPSCTALCDRDRPTAPNCLSPWHSDHKLREG